jgi:hypothetical protein
VLEVPQFDKILNGFQMKRALGYIFFVFLGTEEKVFRNFPQVHFRKKGVMG